MDKETLETLFMVIAVGTIIMTLLVVINFLMKF